MSQKRTLHINRKNFFRKHSNLNLQSKVEAIEARQKDFWDNLMKIGVHYERSIQQYKNTLSSMINEISQAELDSPTIHSIRYRVKDVDSLLVKIIEKSATVPEKPQGNPEIEKYRSLTPSNYYKIITDLIGVRILIRYRYQWETVHKLIWKLYHSDEHEYVRNWETDYVHDPGLNFIAEQPKAYIKLDSDRTIYEAIGKNIFHILPSDNHYASLHYIINFGGAYIELQVRTIFDEAWCECSHDFVYKARITSQSAKNTLEHLSTILAQHTTASEGIVSLMCDIAEQPHRRSKAKLPTEDKVRVDSGKASQTYDEIVQRALLLTKQDHGPVGRN